MAASRQLPSMSMPLIVEAASPKLSVDGLHFFMPRDADSPIVVPIANDISTEQFNQCNTHYSTHCNSLTEAKTLYGDLKIVHVLNCVVGAAGTLMFDTTLDDGEALSRKKTATPQMSRGGSSTNLPGIKNVESVSDLNLVQEGETPPPEQSCQGTPHGSPNVRQQSFRVNRQGSTVDNNLNASNDFFAGRPTPIEQGKQAPVSQSCTGSKLTIRKEYKVPLSSTYAPPGVRLAALNELSVCNKEIHYRHVRKNYLVRFCGSMFDKEKQTVVLETERESGNVAQFVARLTALVKPRAGGEPTNSSFEQDIRSPGSRRSTSPNALCFPPQLPFCDFFDWVKLNEALGDNAPLVWQIPISTSPQRTRTSISSAPVTPKSSFSSGATDAVAQSKLRGFGENTPPPAAAASSSPRRPYQAPLPERIVALLAHNVLTALGHLHEVHGRVHGDIKPKNILLSSKDSCFKLCDFGSANQINAGTQFVHPTEPGSHHFSLTTGAYKAPERMSDFIPSDSPFFGHILYGAAADIFSLGLSMMELLQGEQIERGRPDGSHWGAAEETPPELPSSVSPEMQALVSSMLEREPEKRGTVNKLLDSVEQQWELGIEATRDDLFKAFFVAVTKPERKQKPLKSAEDPVLGKQLDVAPVHVPKRGPNKVLDQGGRKKTSKPAGRRVMQPPRSSSL